MKIDFVSDIACPWCAVGLNALEIALQRIGNDLPVAVHFQPFELNPQMGSEGQDAVEHLSAKYGIGPEQIARNQATIRERGAAVGFTFGTRGRVWNTFALHRLIQWAGTEGPSGQAIALTKAFMEAYHGRADNMTSRAVILACCQQAGLDMARAAEVLDQNLYAQEVRERQAYFPQLGIRSVPAFIVNDKHLISGGQPAEVFVKALRQIAQAVAIDSGLMPLQ